MRDFRAEDYGDFSTPQAVRGAAYKAAADLVDEFILAASGGEFGDGLRTIQRPETPADVVHEWGELSTEWKIACVIGAVFAFILALGLAIRLVCAVARLIYVILVPRSLRNEPALPPAPAPVVVYPPNPPVAAANPARRRNPEPDVEIDPPEAEEEEDEEEADGETECEEQGEAEQEEEEESSRE